MPDEEMTTSATGGVKAQKLARFDLIPAGPLTQLAEHYGRGCTKYPDRNWELGYEWHKSFGAMMRHAWAFWGGEDLDELGSPHLAAVAWHAFALLEWATTHPEFDDRPKGRDREATPEESAREVEGTAVDWLKFYGIGQAVSCGDFKSNPQDTEGISVAGQINSHHNREWSIPEPDYRP